jgi:hypothetical protein
MLRRVVIACPLTLRHFPVRLGQPLDGRSPVLSNGSNVLVRGSTIESISTRSIDAGCSEHRVEIDGGGRVLMPGLIDAHWHAMLASMPIAAMMTADIGYLNLLAGEQATRTLHRGFTTVRDAGGPSFGLKRAIDDGTVAGAAPLRANPRRSPDRAVSSPDHRTRGPPDDPGGDDQDDGGACIVTCAGQESRWWAWARRTAYWTWRCAITASSTSSDC